MVKNPKIPANKPPWWLILMSMTPEFVALVQQILLSVRNDSDWNSPPTEKELPDK
jgi:hypothetical protein